MTPDLVGEPVLAVSIELSSEVSPHLDANVALNSAVCAALEEAMATLMAGLGVPGRAAVTITGQAAMGGPVLRLAVEGRPLRYADDLLLLTYTYVNEKPLDPGLKPAAIVQWLKDRCLDPLASAQTKAKDFICRSCLEIVKVQPAVLFGERQAMAYARTLGQALPESSRSNLQDPGELRSLLGSLLEMGISVANILAVSRALTDEPERPAEMVAEALIDALRAEAAEIQLPRSLLHEITTRQEKDGLTVLPMLRDGLFVELGIEFPPLRLVATERLTGNCFAFKVNDVTSSPFLSLGPDECLINETAERAANLKALPFTNAATGKPASVIKIDEKPAAEAAGLTALNQLQYLAICLAEFLRSHAWWTVHRRGVADQLRTAERYFPSLVSTFRALHADEELTKVLRQLVRDRVSVRNLRVILERWLDYDIIRSTGSTNDAALGNPTAFARVGLGYEIGYKAAKGTDTIVVYVLDAEIERIAARSPDSQLGSEGDGILRALRAEMDYLPPTAMVPKILTFVEARSTLQRLVNSEFPRMSVIAHEELPPGINVQPVARISLA
jgi:flagellar biosynthesis component FlhA